MASKLNEDLMKTNLDLPEGEIKLDGALDPVYADAIDVHNKKKEQIEDALKEQNKLVDEFVKKNDERETKKVTSPELKKMKLEESLFEDYNEQDELNEVTAVLDRPINKSKKFGDKEFSTDYIYKAKRDPLAEIIQDEITSGEKVYRLGDDGKIRPTWAPSLNISYENIGASSDENGEYIITHVANDNLAKQVEAIGDKYGREVRTGFDKYVSDTPNWVKIYLEDSDWDESYFDPNVKTIKDVKK